MACQGRRHRKRGFNPWVGKIPQRRKWQPTPVFLPEKSREQRSLAGYSPWGRTELDTTEQLRTHAHTHTHTHPHTHTHTHPHQCSLLLQTSGGNHGALWINSAPVINYRVDLGLERVRKASGPPLAGELLQSDLESPPQGENVRFSPSLHAAWRGGWFILTPRHRFLFRACFSLSRAVPGLAVVSPS